MTRRLLLPRMSDRVRGRFRVSRLQRRKSLTRGSSVAFTTGPHACGEIFLGKQWQDTSQLTRCALWGATKTVSSFVKETVWSEPHLFRTTHRVNSERPKARPFLTLVTRLWTRSKDTCSCRMLIRMSNHRTRGGTEKYVSAAPFDDNNLPAIMRFGSDVPAARQF